MKQEEQKLAETTIPTESEVLEAMDEFSAGNTFVSVVEPSGLFALDQFAGFDHSNRPTASSASLPSSSESSSALLVVKSSIN